LVQISYIDGETFIY